MRKYLSALLAEYASALTIGIVLVSVIALTESLPGIVRILILIGAIACSLPIARTVEKGIYGQSGYSAGKDSSIEGESMVATRRRSSIFRRLFESKVPKLSGRVRHLQWFVRAGVYIVVAIGLVEADNYGLERGMVSLLLLGMPVLVIGGLWFTVIVALRRLLSCH